MVLRPELEVWESTFTEKAFLQFSDFHSLKSYLSSSNADFELLYDSKLMYWLLLHILVRSNRFLIQMETIFKKVRFTLSFLKLFVFRYPGHLFVMRPTSHISSLMFFLISIIAYVHCICTVFTEEDLSVGQVCILSRIKVTGRFQGTYPDTLSRPLGSKYDFVPHWDPWLLSCSGW